MEWVLYKKWRDLFSKFVTRMWETQTAIVAGKWYLFQVQAIPDPSFRGHLQNITLPKTNMAPENRPSQKETSIPTIHFQVLC